MASRPDRAALLARRGWLYVISDAPRLALHDFEAAIAIDPSMADAYNGRGYARLKTGEHREAVADADKAIGIGAPTSQLLYNAARVYALAAVVAAAEVRKKGFETVAVVARYEDRAAGLLREALWRMPENQRSRILAQRRPRRPGARTLRRRVSSLDSVGDGRQSLFVPAVGASPKSG